MAIGNSGSLEAYAHIVTALEPYLDGVADIWIMPGTPKDERAHFDIRFLSENGPIDPPEMELENTLFTYKLLEAHKNGSTMPYSVRTHAHSAAKYLEKLAEDRSSADSSIAPSIEELAKPPSNTKLNARAYISAWTP